MGLDHVPSSTLSKGILLLRWLKCFKLLSREIIGIQIMGTHRGFPSNIHVLTRSLSCLLGSCGHEIVTCTTVWGFSCISFLLQSYVSLSFSEGLLCARHCLVRWGTQKWKLDILPLSCFYFRRVRPEKKSVCWSYEHIKSGWIFLWKHNQDGLSLDSVKNRSYNFAARGPGAASRDSELRSFNKMTFLLALTAGLLPLYPCSHLKWITSLLVLLQVEIEGRDEIRFSGDLEDSFS